MVRKIIDMLTKMLISRVTNAVREIPRVIIVVLKTTKIFTNTIQIIFIKKLKTERTLMRRRQNGSREENRRKHKIGSMNIINKIITSNSSLGTIVITGILIGMLAVMERNTRNIKRHRRHNVRDIRNFMKILKIRNFTMRTLRIRRVVLGSRKATKTCMKSGKHKEK